MRHWLSEASPQSALEIQTSYFTTVHISPHACVVVCETKVGKKRGSVSSLFDVAGCVDLAF